MLVHSQSYFFMLSILWPVRIRRKQRSQLLNRSTSSEDRKFGSEAAAAERCAEMHYRNFTLARLHNVRNDITFSTDSACLKSESLNVCTVKLILDHTLVRRTPKTNTNYWRLKWKRKSWQRNLLHSIPFVSFRFRYFVFSSSSSCFLQRIGLSSIWMLDLVPVPMSYVSHTCRSKQHACVSLPFENSIILLQQILIFNILPLK